VKKWPRITARKKAPADADAWAKVQDKRELLEEEQPARSAA
jgi:hypothetical protein